MARTGRPVQVSRKEYVVENYFSQFSTKTYVVGTQKNNHNEMVLLNTQSTCLNYGKENILQFYPQKDSLSGPMIWAFLYYFIPHINFGIV